MKKPGTVRSRASIFSVFAWVFRYLPEQLDRYRGDLRGPDTTTRARTAGSGEHGIQILPPLGGITKLTTPPPPGGVPPELNMRSTRAGPARPSGVVLKSTTLDP